MPSYIFVSPGSDPGAGLALVDPMLSSSRPTMGTCRPDLRRMVKPGDHIFVISGSRGRSIPQYVIGGMQIDEKLEDQLEALRRLPQNALRFDGNRRAGNIIALGIDEGDNWYHFSNPTKSSIGQMDDKLDAWQKRPTVKKAVLVTVLKQVDHLDNLAEVLTKLALGKVPVLVIDDESDQAGLNNKAAKIRAQRAAANARSSTYDRICVVRDQLPHHSYLQYTATPQANLLLAQTDLLNPSFAELVTPGSAYTGGLAFFPKVRPLIVEIPAREVPGRTTVVNSAPKSLLSALRFYLLVCAQHAITRVRGKDRNRSMMVHPAMQTQSHKVYKAWMDKSIKTLTSYVEKQYAKLPAEVESRFLPEYCVFQRSWTPISG